MEDLVTLPLGFITEEGEVIKDIMIKGMTTRIRKSITSPQFKKNPQKLITFILRQCISQIGERDSISLDDARIMTATDREFLFVEIRRISLGEEINVRFQCPYCNKVQDVVIDITQLPLKKVNVDNFEIENQRFIAHFKNSKLKLDVKMKIPCGYDLEDISSIDDPMKANYKTYELCLVEWNGAQGPFDGDFIDTIPVSADDWLTEELSKVQGGYDLYPTHECYDCGGESVVSLADSDFLFKTRR